MIWQDPLLPVIAVPSDLEKQWFRLGSARFQLLPKQYVFLQAQEEFVGYVSGYGGGKTKVGSILSSYLSMEPHNRGVVGMDAATDLDEAAQRDLLEFLYEAQLLKQAPKSNNRTALVHCIDPATGKNLGYDSEISFSHLDDPKHVRGRHLGWVWVDEGSKVKKEAWQNLIGRLRLPSFRKRYKAFVTGNPEGRNWIYDFFFNDEMLTQMTCGGQPGTHVKQCLDRDDKKCNARLRRKRRAIHCTSFENYFLPPEYLENMLASFSEEERKRYLEGSFDVFEGQAFKEFDHDIHVIQPPETWIDGRPPKEWKRILACDVGGATYWAFIWCAVDPWGNLVFYDEIYSKTTNIDALADAAKPKMLSEEGTPYNFQAKVIDYENKLAAEDLRRRGITFTNAQKHGKASSVQRFSGYLHRNAKHHFPDYHVLSGEPNSPRAFFTYGCRNLIRELPQQRWKEEVSRDGRLKNELDRALDNHATDCLDGATEVLTDRGIIAIRDLVGTTGMLVTPEGWARYLGAEKTRIDSETVVVRFSNGRTVRTTPDHLFLTPAGWVKASAMTDCLCYTADIWTSNSFRANAIENTEASDISAAEQSGSIGWSGSTAMARFQMDGTSTTRTEIHPTTLLETLNWLKQENISATTAFNIASGRANTSTPSGTSPRNGMERRLESSGTVTTLASLLERHSQSASSYVDGVSSHLPASPVMSDRRRFAPIVAVLQSVEPPDLMTNRGHAPIAAYRSRLTDTSRNGTVRCVAVTTAERTDTYCLHVDHPTHAFAVNGGIFVHNCALYIARELPDPSTLKPNPYAAHGNNKSKISQLYYADLKRQEEQRESETRRPYRPGGTGVLDR